MTLHIANCPRCGKVFTPGIYDICAACVKKAEEEYEQCYQYLKEHKGATIHDVSEQTGVPIRQITKFIREGRISLLHLPNLGYPCESCGTLIRNGVVCPECHSKFAEGVKMIRQQQRVDQSLSKAEKASFNIAEGRQRKRF